MFLNLRINVCYGSCQLIHVTLITEAVVWAMHLCKQDAFLISSVLLKRFLYTHSLQNILFDSIVSLDKSR